MKIVRTVVVYTLKMRNCTTEVIKRIEIKHSMRYALSCVPSFLLNTVVYFSIFCHVKVVVVNNNCVQLRFFNFFRRLRFTFIKERINTVKML